MVRCCRAPSASQCRTNDRGMTESVHGPSGRQSMDHVVGRLAPTPSGRLHLGNVCAFAARLAVRPRARRTPAAPHRGRRPRARRPRGRRQPARRSHLARPDLGRGDAASVGARLCAGPRRARAIHVLLRLHARGDSGGGRRLSRDLPRSRADGRGDQVPAARRAAAVRRSRARTSCHRSQVDGRSRSSAAATASMPTTSRWSPTTWRMA